MQRSKNLVDMTIPGNITSEMFLASFVT